MSEAASMRRLAHFIWDFDGTLFDTYPIIIQNLRGALAAFGRDADPADAMRRMLDTILAARDHYADSFGIPREALAHEYGLRHREATRQLAAPPMPGVEAVLRRICATGRHTYIFTHRAQAETEAYLHKYGLSELFCEIVAPQSPCFAAKPAPDAVLYLKEKYRMAEGSAVMLGDREIDLGSGRAAGIATAHIVCAAAPETLACDWRFDSFDEMLALL